MHVLLRAEPACEADVVVATDTVITTVPVRAVRVPADAMELDEPPVCLRQGSAPHPGRPRKEGSPGRGTSTRTSGVRLDIHEEAALRFGLPFVPHVDGDPYADDPAPPFC